MEQPPALDELVVAKLFGAACLAIARSDSTFARDQCLSALEAGHWGVKVVTISGELFFEVHVDGRLACTVPARVVDPGGRLSS